IVTAKPSIDVPLSVAVVGCGAWGRNLVRTFHTVPGSRLAAVCDLDEKRLGQMRTQFPGVRTTTDYDALCREPELDAVVIGASADSFWSFAPHDISVMNFLMGAQPVSVSARGQAYITKGVEDVVFAVLRYPGDRIGQIHVSWLDPHKVRRTTLVGSKKMAVF